MGIFKLKIKTLLVFLVVFFILGLLYFLIKQIVFLKGNSKAVIQNKTESVVKEVTSLDAPLYPKMSLEVFKFRQTQIQELVKLINSDIANGNIASAQKNLAALKDQLKQLSDPRKLAVISKETRQKHDPENKYIPKNETIDPEILPYYLDVIDSLVRIEQESEIKE